MNVNAEANCYGKNARTQISLRRNESVSGVGCLPGKELSESLDYIAI